MRRATGIDLLEDLSEFFRSFGAMSRGFRERAENVRSLLASPRTTFVLVTSPRRRAIAEAIDFRHRLFDAGLPFGAAVVNRVHAVERGATARGLAKVAGEELGRKVADSLTDNRRLAAGDQANLSALKRRLGRKPMIEVPELDDEVHDLAGLRGVGEYLFGPREEPRMRWTRPGAAPERPPHAQVSAGAPASWARWPRTKRDRVARDPVGTVRRRPAAALVRSRA